jgi:hypothetical protein
MDTEKLIRLEQELQAELGLTQELYEEVLKLLHILADDDATNDKTWLWIPVMLFSPFGRNCVLKS